MASPRSSSATRRGSKIASVVSVVAVLMLAGCGSDSDTAGSADTAPASDVSVTETPGPDDPAPESSITDMSTTDTSTGETVPADTAIGDGGTGDASAVCGGLSAADVGAAVGAGNFDRADDISVDADVSCVFSNSTSVYAITISTESTSTYLAGDLDGLSIEESLLTLESTQALFLAEGYSVEQVTVAGGAGIVVTGLNGIDGEAAGYAATVVDGVVYETTASGAELAAEPADFGPIMSAVLELAVGA